jgi:hypothetical protein
VRKARIQFHRFLEYDATPEEREQFLANSGLEEGNDDLVKDHGVKRVPVLYLLLY